MADQLPAVHNAHPDYIGPIITEPGPIDPNTGTRRVDLWRESTAGGQWGDLAIAAGGYGYTARYVSDDGHGCAEVGIYPVRSEPTSVQIVEHALMQGASRERVAIWTDDQLMERYGEPPGLYGVDEQSTCGKAITEDGIVRPDDSADISYEGGSALAFATLEQAQAEADRLGREDQSFAIYLRKREGA